MECAPEIGLELVPDLVIILIFAGPDDAVTGAIGNDIYSSPMFQALGKDCVDG